MDIQQPTDHPEHLTLDEAELILEARAEEVEKIRESLFRNVTDSVD